MEGPLQSLRQSIIQLPAPKTVRLWSCVTVLVHAAPRVCPQVSVGATPACQTCRWQSFGSDDSLGHSNSSHKLLRGLCACAEV